MIALDELIPEFIEADLEKKRWTNRRCDLREQLIGHFTARKLDHHTVDSGWVTLASRPNPVFDLSLLERMATPEVVAAVTITEVNNQGFRQAVRLQAIPEHVASTVSTYEPMSPTVRAIARSPRSHETPAPSGHFATDIDVITQEFIAVDQHKKLWTKRREVLRLEVLDSFEAHGLERYEVNVGEAQVTKRQKLIVDLPGLERAVDPEVLASVTTQKVDQTKWKRALERKVLSRDIADAVCSLDTPSHYLTARSSAARKQ